jgi:hypothetical protein
MVKYYIHIVTCHLSSQPIERFVARQQLCKYATIMQTLLGSSYRVTMEIQLEGVFYVVRPDAISRQLPVTSYEFRARYSRQ